jgi:NAD(P)-dependent dehydrogenase (short-subunit alcohol dehydrogenase family)
VFKVFFCEKHEIAQMLKQSPVEMSGAAKERAMRGSIVNIASMAGTAALTELSAYVSSKHAVIVMARCDARTYGADKIRINCVSPGFVNTPMMQNAGLSEEYMGLTQAQSPMNRFTLAEEVAESAVFLSSSCASGITGANLNVDAGANLFHVI